MKNIIILLSLCFLINASADSAPSFTPMPKMVSSAETNSIDVSNLDEQQSKSVMDYLLAQKHIPYSFVEDGCYTQAHEIYQILQKYNIITGKAFILPNAGLLYPEALRSVVNPSFSGWRYHVAPFILVDGEVRVLDPTLGKEALSLKNWAKRQNKDSDNAEVEFILRQGSYMFHDSSYQPQDSGIERLQDLVRLRAELGENEFWWQFEQGWI